MYCTNNMVIVDHRGLFIYVEPDYPGAYHDVNVLRHSSLMMDWRNHFTHSDAEDYFEYLLGDPGYVGADMFIMRRFGSAEMPANVHEDVVDAFNKLHSGRRIKVEWGIGGLKRKFRRFLKTFDNKRPRFKHLFITGCILTNFLHRRRWDMTMTDMGRYEGRSTEDNYNWYDGEQ